MEYTTGEYPFVSTTPSHTSTASILDMSSEYEEHRKKQIFYERLFLELFTAVAIFSIAANVILAFTILKYKKLRKSTTNLLFLHLIFLEAGYLFATPTVLRLFIDFEIYLHVNFRVICAIGVLEIVLSLGTLMFVILLLVDWYLKTYSESKYERFRRVCKFLLAIIYLVVVSFFALTAGLCDERSGFAIIILIIATVLLSLLVLLTVIVLNIVHKVKSRRLQDRRRSNMGLAIANILALTWCPLLLNIIISFWRVHYVYPVILSVVFCIASPVFNLIYLYIRDNDFNVFLKKVFTCRCNDYVNEDLDETPVCYSGESGAQINGVVILPQTKSSLSFHAT